jgi:hypothetical protein
MKKIITLLIALSLSNISLSDNSYYKDKEFYYNDEITLINLKERILKQAIYKRYNKNKVSKEQLSNILKKIESNKVASSKLLSKKYNSFKEYELYNDEECDYQGVSSDLDSEDYLYHGLWHLNYINSHKMKQKESTIAIIDGYLSNNRLLPNLKIENCLDSNNKSCNYGLDMLDISSNKIFKGINDHTYWVASIIGGKSCKNKDSYFKQKGINTKANMLMVNISIYRDKKTLHNLNKLIDAIDELDKNNINVIYTPLVFVDYSKKQFHRLQASIDNYLSKPNRSIIGVIGNANNVSKNDKPIPCVIKGVVCVGGIDRNGMIWSGGRNIEKYIDIYAPATSIIGGLDKNSMRFESSGVSAAGAIVAGMVSNVIREDNYKELILKITKGSKLILNKDGTIKRGKRAASY